MRTPSSISDKPNRLPAQQFWGLCLAIYFILQFPLVRIPVLFLSTWAHEFGHGLGALMTGGSFRELTIFPNFSGLALTGTSNGFQRVTVIVMGLLGPSLLGALLILLTRALGWYRFALWVMTGLLLLSQIWAADLFTRSTLGGAALLFGIVAWKVPAKAVVYVAYIVAIALCLTALTGFGYFFIGNADIAGQVFRSDTGVLSDILGGPHWLWGGLLAGLSIIILVASVFMADRWAMRGRRVSAA